MHTNRETEYQKKMYHTPDEPPETVHDIRFVRDFSQLVCLWQKVNSARQKGSTRWKYQYLIERHILPELGQYALHQLSSDLLDSFINSKLKQGRLAGGGLSPSYVRSMAGIIHSVLLFAAEEGVAVSVKRPVRKPTAARREITVLTVAEQKLLEQYLLTAPSLTELGILLSLNTGLRIGEVCALSWDSIDLYDNTLSVKGTVVRVPAVENGAAERTLAIDTPKTPSSLRKIPIPSKLHAVLRQKKPDQPGLYLLSGTTSVLSPRTYEYRFHRVLAQSGVRPVNYHVLRHTFATRCIELGMDIKTLSELLGHANPTITLNIYVHSSIERKREQIERLSLL